jgi:hypothetical protein
MLVAESILKLIENEDCAKILTEKQYVPFFFSLILSLEF